MNTKTRIFAAAILTVLAMPAAASAQQAMFLPSSYSWDQAATANVPADARASVGVPRRVREPHAARPYGQW
jgi:hypothetical protein